MVGGYILFNKSGEIVQQTASNASPATADQVKELERVFAILAENVGQLEIAFLGFTYQETLVPVFQGASLVTEMTPFRMVGAADRVLTPELYGQESFTAEQAIAAVAT